VFANEKKSSRSFHSVIKEGGRRNRASKGRRRVTWGKLPTETTGGRDVPSPFSPEVILSFLRGRGKKGQVGKGKTGNGTPAKIFQSKKPQRAQTGAPILFTEAKEGRGPGSFARRESPSHENRKKKGGRWGNRRKLYDSSGRSAVLAGGSTKFFTLREGGEGQRNPFKKGRPGTARDSRERGSQHYFVRKKEEPLRVKEGGKEITFSYIDNSRLISPAPLPFMERGDGGLGTKKGRFPLSSRGGKKLHEEAKERGWRGGRVGEYKAKKPGARQRRKAKRDKVIPLGERSLYPSYA